MSNNKHFNKALLWVNRNNIAHVRANTDDIASPKSYYNRTRNKEIIPDITGRRKRTKFFIEIATKTEDLQSMISKWKFLQTMAEMAQGKFLLLSPRGHLAFTKRIVERYGIQAEVHSLALLKN